MPRSTGPANWAEKSNPKTAVMHAFKSMELAALSDAPPRIGEPFPEIAAAHLLAEMVKSDEASDMLTAAEVERLERFYGKVDSSGKQVKIRRLVVAAGMRFRRGETTTGARRSTGTSTPGP